ncbi:ATP-grasp domain-containing protein [Bradyrhizobium japonicum]|uniref:ATP-grasp domain-containing protein n=1 Tax=Bradyrhizobium japonicum TaxID=375 RepID=UPI001BA472C7|nr:ATP-grasp domain-containing protein [Bradyrhizobium japonicum]MBR0764489.1 ATP-grasp domain-containing protein [Bradyrhizobium japonicum]
MLAVFVTPWLSDSTEKLASLATELPSAKLALIYPKNAGSLPASLRKNLVAWSSVGKIHDPEHLLTALQRIERSVGKVDRIFAETEQLQLPLADLRERANLPGLGSDVAMRFRDKAIMKQHWSAAGLAVARHALVTTLSAALSFVEVVGFPVVAKPRFGARAKNTFLVKSPSDMVRALNRIKPRNGAEALVEEFIDGEEFSCDCVTVRGQPLWQSFVKYSPTPLQANLNPSVQWSALLPRELDDPQYCDVREAAEKAISSLGMQTGYTHMEWFRMPNGGCVMSEIAARPPGAEIDTLLSYAHDFSFTKEWLRLSILGDSRRLPPRKYSTGVIFLRAPHAGKVASIRGLRKLTNKYRSLIVEKEIPERGEIVSRDYEGNGHIIIRHPRTSVVTEVLHEIATTIEIQSVSREVTKRRKLVGRYGLPGDATIQRVGAR